jgi:hypothetical protein
MVSGTKICPGTGGHPRHVEQLHNFTNDKNRADGKAAFCKFCAAAIQRAWRQANPGKVRAYKQLVRDRKKVDTHASV